MTYMFLKIVNHEGLPPNYSPWFLALGPGPWQQHTIMLMNVSRRWAWKLPSGVPWGVNSCLVRQVEICSSTTHTFPSQFTNTMICGPLANNIFHRVKDIIIRSPRVVIIVFCIYVYNIPTYKSRLLPTNYYFSSSKITTSVCDQSPLLPLWVKRFSL